MFTLNKNLEHSLELPQMKPTLFTATLAAVASLQMANAATITVNTANNDNPGAGQTSLVMALQQAQAGDTIAFNIPGDGPHYIKTPVNGYPLIVNDDVTIDGYSQPGASANTNPIRAANNAKLKIVLDSRDGGRTAMNYNTGRPGYGDGENAILGVFNAANVSIKGLAFLGLYTQNSDVDPGVYCVAFARDHTGAPNYDDNAHVSGCWFGVEPDGTSVTGGSAAAIAAFRHRDVSGGPLPELPNRDMTVGVKAGSANPRAEFNVMVGMSYNLAGEQTGTCFSGNFVGMLPDGMTPYDLTVENPGQFAGASMEIGRYNDSTIIVGTDGDGVNDADEGNIFGPLTGGQTVVAFYGTGNKKFIIAGNYFGVAVDGVTSLPGAFRILGDSFSAASVQFGSDFNGVSDAWEGNVVHNNHPTPDFLVMLPINASAGAKLSVRGNSLVNNYPLPVNMAASSLGLPDPLAFYAPHLEAVEPLVIQPTIAVEGSNLVGTAPLATASFAATIIDLYEADPEGIENGKLLSNTDLPNGFVQGKRYIASFVDNSAADMNPAPGAFKFSLSGKAAAGKLLTATANYSIQAAGTTRADVVTSPFSEPVAGPAPGKTIVVNTANNDNPGAGQTSLVMALQQALDRDTIAFNIPGDGPHYIKTPVNGYPLIVNDDVTIDGYSQPGASANTNPIRAANNAKLKIVLDSRDGGRTAMNYNTGRPGYGDGENAILGVFNAANVSIKGLAFLGLYTQNSDVDPGVYCVAFARDHTGAPNYDDNAHVSGCWFGVEPDGTSVTGGSAAAIAAFRHRDVSGGPLPELPNRDMTVGVKAGSANPRAEFNVMVGMSYNLAGEQTGTCFSGNFVGMLPDGMTPYDLTVENPGQFAGASMEIGRYNDSTIIVGTDGDGVNDADEGNIFGPLTGGQTVVAFYGTGNKKFIIAGNYFGVAVDGVTSLPGAFRILGDSFSAASVQFGSDFNGVSDAWEGNVVHNNHPTPDFLVMLPINASAGAKLSVRGNSLVNNYPLPVNMAASSLGLPDPLAFYAPHLEAVEPLVIQPTIAVEGSNLVGTAPLATASFAATIIDLYEADPEGIENGKLLSNTDLPNGFVQGKRYIASFVDNSPDDMNPAPGAFSFDLTGKGAAGLTLTATANYSVQAAGTTRADVVTSPFSEPSTGLAAELKVTVVRNTDGTATLSWPAALTGVSVESKASLSDTTWTPVGGVVGNSVKVTIPASGNAFYRLKR
jgi:hypothetical protein